MLRVRPPRLARKIPGPRKKRLLLKIRCYTQTRSLTPSQQRPRSGKIEGLLCFSSVLMHASLLDAAPTPTLGGASSRIHRRSRGYGSTGRPRPRRYQRRDTSAVLTPASSTAQETQVLVVARQAL